MNRNMNTKNVGIGLVIFAIVGAAVYFSYQGREVNDSLQEIAIETAQFQVKIPASGTVKPENKISINSPIAGRIDRIVIEEGQRVKKGQIIAWMSSTDRAALMDSARLQNSDSMEEWEEIYRKTPITAPASGEIISRAIVPGQTVSQQTLLFELSDRLVVVADLDETDLGRIRLGQPAQIRVDSFPDILVRAKVIRIAKQSQLKNNINTYEVLLIADDLPREFRSGMTANIHFIYRDKPSALLLPTWVAEGRENFSREIRLKSEGKSVELRKLKLGLSNGKRIEVLAGAEPGDVFLVKAASVLNEAAAVPFGVMGGGRKK